MMPVEVLYRCTMPPSEQVALALARIRDVYGIRRLTLDRKACTVRVEYDATRLNMATVTKLVAMAGLQIAEDLLLLASPPSLQPPSAPAAS
jgi:hypothetical protein